MLYLLRLGAAHVITIDNREGAGGALSDSGADKSRASQLTGVGQPPRHWERSRGRG